MIREFVGILSASAAVLGLIAGFGETQPIQVVIVLCIGAWGLA